MRYQRCEFCERPAYRQYSAVLAPNGVSTDYVRYSCKDNWHEAKVRRLVGLDGIIEWVERVSDEFQIEETPPKVITGD